MVKLTHPLNKDGVLYEAGTVLTLSISSEEALIKNGLAESYTHGVSKEEQEEVKRVSNIEDVKKQTSSTKKKSK